jgi:hypothetical protein
MPSVAQTVGQQIIGGFNPAGKLPVQQTAGPTEPLYSRLMNEDINIGKDRVKFPRVSIQGN